MGDFALTGKYADVFKKPFIFDPSTSGSGSPQIGIAPNTPAASEIIKTPDDGESFGSLIRILRDPAYMKEQLKAKAEFDREQMRAAAPYKLLFDIPGQITQAFTLPGQLAMEGANRVANTVMEGVRALPAPQVVARSAQYTPTSYFGRG